MDTKNVQHSTSLLRQATDHKSLYSKLISNGHLGRQDSRLGEEFGTDSKVHGALATPATNSSIQPAAPKSGLRLPVANETEASRATKIAGEAPASSSHQFHLVDNELAAAISERSTKQYASSYRPMETPSLHSRTTGTGSPRVQFDPDALFEELDATLQLRSNKDSSYTRPGNSMQMKRDEETELDRLTNRLIHCMRTGKDECAICGLAISGKACVALDQTYHVECFTCVACGQNLAGKSFYLADGKHYCEKDFLDTLEKCASCYMPITEKILRAIGKSYHPLCFVCSVCSKCLDGVGFTVDESNRVHCVDCFHSKHAPRCATCMKPIVPERGAQESTRIIALDKSFHVNCYKCEDCGLLLSSSIEGHECYPLDNHLLCRSCNTARICQMTT